jgi:hypothetical protein
MTVSTPVRSRNRLKRKPLLGIAAAVAAAAAVGSALSLGHGEPAEVAGRPVSSGATRLASLTPEEKRYVDWVAAATPEQLAAAFGHEPARRIPPQLKPGANTR